MRGLAADIEIEKMIELRREVEGAALLSKPGDNAAVFLAQTRINKGPAEMRPPKSLIRQEPMLIGGR